jgi:hypothetical protein
MAALYFGFRVKNKDRHINDHYTLLEELDLPIEVLFKLYHGNAAKVYDLKNDLNIRRVAHQTTHDGSVINGFLPLAPSNHPFSHDPLNKPATNPRMGHSLPLTMIS